MRLVIKYRNEHRCDIDTVNLLKPDKNITWCLEPDKDLIYKDYDKVRYSVINVIRMYNPNFQGFRPIPIIYFNKDKYTRDIKKIGDLLNMDGGI